MTGHVIIGEYARPNPVPRCGSSIANIGCKFGLGELDCAAEGWVYNDCPYRQSGGQIADYRRSNLPKGAVDAE